MPSRELIPAQVAIMNDISCMSIQELAIGLKVASAGVLLNLALLRQSATSLSRSDVVQKLTAAFNEAGLTLLNEVPVSRHIFTSDDIRGDAVGHCFSCNSLKERVELKQCSKCHGPRYCSTMCQRTDWKTHKLYCSERSRSYPSTYAMLSDWLSLQKCPVEGCLWTQTGDVYYEAKFVRWLPHTQGTFCIVSESSVAGAKMEELDTSVKFLSMSHAQDLAGYLAPKVEQVLRDGRSDMHHVSMFSNRRAGGRLRENRRGSILLLESPDGALATRAIQHSPRSLEEANRGGHYTW